MKADSVRVAPASRAAGDGIETDAREREAGSGEALARRSRVLVVDDERSVRLGLRRFFERRGLEVVEASTCREADAACAAAPDVAILDYCLPDGDGIELLEQMKRTTPGIAVIMLTGHGTIDLAVRAIKTGADQLFTKPVDMEALLVLVQRLVEDRRSRQRRMADDSRHDQRPPDPFLGTSEAVRALELQARRVAAADGSVLIQGETGSGKGVLARFLHENGPRRAEAFVDINCAALSRELLESELFGHEAGSFTGANRTKPGLFEIANRGTVFLDEVGDMDPAVQARVLKVLEEKRFRRVGDVHDRHVDIRLVAATNRDLQKRIAEGTFREDLFFRIHTLPLRVPSLRERREDIPLLAERLLEAVASPHRRDVRLSSAAMSRLCAYSWPGNIRELRNVLERAAIVCDGDVIDPPALSLDVQEPATAGAFEPLTLAELERRHITRMLALEQGNVGRAAQRLGISTSSLYERLQRYGLREKRTP